MKDESVDLGIWDILTQAVVWLIGIAIVVAIGYLCFPVLQKNVSMRERNLEIEAQIQREEDAARHLKTSLDTLRSDPKAIERLAREKLGYAKPGEIVIRFQEPATSAPARP